MTSTTPPLPLLPSRLTPRRGSPPDCSGQPNRINGPIILASVSVSFTLVAGIFAWIATHPHKAAPLPPSISVAIVEAPAAPPAPPAPPQAPVFSAAPAFHHTPREEKSSKAPLLEVKSPPLPPPASPQTKQDSRQWDRRLAGPTELPPEPKKPAGETYGTQVLFLNNQEAAADIARREHKLMFVMHISGHFEDSCFT